MTKTNKKRGLRSSTDGESESPDHKASWHGEGDQEENMAAAASSPDTSSDIKAGNPNSHLLVQTIGVEYLRMNPERFIESNIDNSWLGYLTNM